MRLLVTSDLHYNHGKSTQIAEDLPAEKVVSMFLTTWRERKEFIAKH